ncbi:MAG: hypothetical protein ACRDF0_07685 [Candidatus Limnocylindria bacterium]
MTRPAATGLATAFFRMYLLEALASGPARPAALLARVAGECLPFATGAFSRALQSLLEGGHLTPAPEGAVALTSVGAAERVAERERWSAVVPAVTRMLGEVPARPAPLVVREAPPPYRERPVADAYLDRVLLAAIRERIVIARESGRPFALALGVVDLTHPAEATRRAMLHRTIRGTFTGASTVFGGDVDVFRYGEAGIALVVPLGGDVERADRIAALLRARLDELVRGMSASVRMFHGARWQVRAASVTWTGLMATSGALIEAARGALEADGERSEVA